MGYGDEKVVVDVKDVEHGEICYTDGEGKEHTYYPCRWIWLDVQDLAVWTILNAPKDDGAQPSLATRVRGTVMLEDRSISVVGDPGTRVRELSLALEAGEWRPPSVPYDISEPTSFGNHLGGAMLGFNRADWEAGTDDDWWISCYLPKDFIDSLVSDIRSGQLNSMRLTLTLRSLYTTEHSFAPVSSRGHLFIRPNRKDNSLEIPDLAQGYVNAVHFSSAPIDLRKPEPIDIGPAENEPVLTESQDADTPTPDPTAAALTALGTRVDELRSTLKWVGGFIVVALLFVAFR